MNADIDPREIKDVRQLTGAGNSDGFNSLDLAPDPAATVEWWYVHGRWRDKGGRERHFMASFFRGPWVGAGTAPAMLFAAVYDLEGGKALKLSAVSPGMVALLHGVIDEAGQGRSPTWLTRLAKDGFGRAARARAGDGLELAEADADLGAGPLDLAWQGFAMSQDDCAYRLSFAIEDSRADLRLRAASVWSRFGAESPAARVGITDYRSCPRLALEGEFNDCRVEGEAWIDHQRGDIGQILSQPDGRLKLLGWEWFALNLKGGPDLMLYQPRDQFSRRVEHPFGAVFEAGGWQGLDGGYTARPTRWLRGPMGANRYPVDWTIEVPGLDLALTVRSLTDLGELPVYGPMGFNWQGPLAVEGQRAGEGLGGTGWLELNGYGYPVTVGGQLRFWGSYFASRLRGA